MSWILEVVGIWFGALTVGLLAMVGVFWLHDLLADRRTRRRIAGGFGTGDRKVYDTYDAAMERYRREAHRLGAWASQLEEIQNLPEVYR